MAKRYIGLDIGGGGKREKMKSCIYHPSPNFPLPFCGIDLSVKLRKTTSAQRKGMSPGWSGGSPAYLGTSVPLSQWPASLKKTAQFRKLSGKKTNESRAIKRAAKGGTTVRAGRKPDTTTGRVVSSAVERTHDVLPPSPSALENGGLANSGTLGKGSAIALPSSTMRFGTA